MKQEGSHRKDRILSGGGLTEFKVFSHRGPSNLGLFFSNLTQAIVGDSQVTTEGGLVNKKFPKEEENQLIKLKKGMGIKENTLLLGKDYKDRRKKEKGRGQILETESVLLTWWDNNQPEIGCKSPRNTNPGISGRDETGCPVKVGRKAER